MTVTVRLFAILRERAGRDSVEIELPDDATVGDLISSVTSRLRLPLNDSQGRPVTYAARARGASLNETDRVGDVLEENEVVTLTQNVTAG